MSFDIDHVGFAVHDAGVTLRRLYDSGFLVPVAGEEDDTFRYVIGRRETARGGIRVELLDPHGDEHGFLARYLRSHDEGAHHVTFMADDLDETLERARRLGVEVVQVDLSFPPWREAFIHPRQGLGTLVQVASSVHDYPAGADPRGEIDPVAVPHRRTGRNRRWWRETIGSDLPTSTSTVVDVQLGVADTEFAGEVFGHLLGGQADGCHFSWPSGSVSVAPSDVPTVSLQFVGVTGSPQADHAIGTTQFHRLGD